jgi:TPR repeat protein
VYDWHTFDLATGGELEITDVFDGSKDEIVDRLQKAFAVEFDGLMEPAGEPKFCLTESGIAYAPENIFGYQRGVSLVIPYDADFVKTPFTERGTPAQPKATANSGNENAESDEDTAQPGKAELQEGLKYYEGNGVEKNYAEAIRWFKKSAENGNVVAMENIGYMYEIGNGVQQDYEEARNWYQKALDAGSENAAEYLASMDEPGSGEFIEGLKYYDYYDEGIWGEEDCAKAMRWFKKSAENGNTEAMRAIGTIYSTGGNGVQKDYKLAMKWYKQAADLGNTGAMLDLGNMYENGEGVKQNFNEARGWYSKANQAGNEYARELLVNLDSKNTNKQSLPVKPDGMSKSIWLATVLTESEAEALYKACKIDFGDYVIAIGYARGREEKKELEKRKTVRGEVDLPEGVYFLDYPQKVEFFFQYGNLYYSPKGVPGMYLNISNPERVRDGCKIRILANRNLIGQWETYSIGNFNLVIDAEVID